MPNYAKAVWENLYSLYMYYFLSFATYYNGY